MIYIYRRKFSEGARDLADVLNDLGTPARYTQGRALERFRADRDRLVNWGDVGGEGLNSTPLQNKLQDALTLTAAGIPTITVSTTQPADTTGERPGLPIEAQTLTAGNAHVFIAGILQWLTTPLPPAATWLGRRNFHVGGDDLLAPPPRPDYWARKETLTDEFRLHMFAGKSIRAGQKVRREMRPDGVTPSHPWIRSFDAGWILAYEAFKSTKPMRDIAAGAVEALHLDFGAVDIGRKEDGSLMVLEVNRAPGLEGGTIHAYAEALRRTFAPAGT